MQLLREHIDLQGVADTHVYRSWFVRWKTHLAKFQRKAMLVRAPQVT